MSLFYMADGREWHCWVSDDGTVHDEPVQPLDESLETCGEDE